MTDCGQRVPCIETPEFFIKFINLKPRLLATIDFWGRQGSCDFLLFNWHLLLNGEELPSKDLHSEQAWEGYQLDADKTEIRQSTEDLLNEAKANKKWTIPWGARVQLNIGPIHYIKIYERINQIYFLFLDKNDDFEVGNLNTESNTWNTYDLCPIFDEDDHKKENDYLFVSDGADNPIFLGVTHLLAAIIRDFWVVENRETIFQQKQLQVKRFGAGDDSKPLIVYLPRINYNHRPNLNRCERDLGHKERRVHFVRNINFAYVWIFHILNWLVTIIIGRLKSL
jgi:hypothetical protein